MLTGVSETALLTLNGRAYQASRPDAIIEDPMAIKLVDSIDFDFDKFGRKGQEMALRSLAVDRCAMEYLRSHPKATVVALAEGFQTSFWRLDSALPQRGFPLGVGGSAAGHRPARATAPAIRHGSSISRSPRWTTRGWTASTTLTASSSPRRAC